MTSLIDMKGREHSELQEKNIKEFLANGIKNEISGLKLTTNTVARYLSMTSVKEQGVDEERGLW